MKHNTLPPNSKGHYTFNNRALAHKANVKSNASQKARRQAGVVKQLTDYKTDPPRISQASRELLPRILAEEIAWRSELLATVASMRSLLLRAIHEKAYLDRTTLPALVKEIRSLLEFEMKVVESTKAIHTGDSATRQVTGLIARYGLLRTELTRKGLMNPDGSLRLPQPTGAAIAEAPIADQGVEGDRHTTGPGLAQVGSEEEGAPPETTAAQEAKPGEGVS